MELAIIISVILIIYVLSKSNKGKSKKKTQPDTLNSSDTKIINMSYKPKYILSKNEYIFYNELKKITDKNNLIICPKVGLKDLFEITDKSNYMSLFGRIAQKHIDFLICDDKLRPKYAIEVDDNSHKGKEESDNFKNKLFENNNLKIIRIKAQMEYSEEYILRNLDLIKEIPKETPIKL